ncbi:pre-mRNA-splicing regulator female-lethal(2)D isoform X1 [Homalodisca vitripennis]|uniref:pre-mRNA-splicing regulator female-lethal(2)D isoform X1 n=1 Tax=Homalodisca vitripennis TaxID=197043 RepID=UPI001EEADC53|nr:pre-mRNA-splicing regulator female-lethal(2)D isoform X1 [Homalodisca vitripennis]
MLDENTTCSPPISASVVASPGNAPSGASAAPGGAVPGGTRLRLTEQQLESASKEELVAHCKQQDTYIDSLLSQATSHEAEMAALRETEDRLRQQHADLLLREKVLVRRLAAKEQEMQEYAGQLSELKAREAPGVSALRSALLDPAVNLLLQKLRQELAATRTRVEETQNELSAWKFTPDSNTGKRLMAKCRLLYQENEELGRVIASGRVAKLEGELALQKSFSEEVKKSQSELDEFLQDLDEDVEGMQSTIYYLQQELRKAKDTLAAYEQERKAGTANGKSACNGDSGSETHASPPPPPPRRRTSSEDSDDLPLIKKVRRDSELSVHYSDEEVGGGLTNGESSAK